MSSLISSQTSTNFWKVFTDDGEPSVEKVRFSSDLGSITTRFKNLGNGLLKSTILENKMALFGLIQGMYLKNKNCFAKDLHWNTFGLRS